MRIGKSFPVLGAVLLLAGACSTYVLTGPFTVDSDLGRAKVSRAIDGSFEEHLRVKYLALSEREYAEADYADASWYAEQAAMASTGRTPPPAVVEGANFMTPDEAVAELQTARKDLLDALGAGGREKAPNHASTAQTMFDCWVEEQEENHEFDEIAACQAGFMDAMEAMAMAMAPPPPPPPPPSKPAEPTSMEVKEPPARDFLVFFDFDKDKVREDAAQILAQVLEVIESLKPKGVVLTGHADRAGPSTYNQKLSEKRAASVKKWLRKNGVEGDTIWPSGRGETDPRVKTADGVREQENRRVEIHIE